MLGCGSNQVNEDKSKQKQIILTVSLPGAGVKNHCHGGQSRLSKISIGATPTFAPRKSGVGGEYDSATIPGLTFWSRSRWLKLSRSVSIGPSATHESGHFYFAQTGHSHFAATFPFVFV